MSNNSSSLRNKEVELWEELKSTREKVINTIAQNMHIYGITPSIGRLYGTMYFHGEPMTLDEMRDSLAMSKTSMSTSVRALSEIKMVHKKWRKGERKNLYRVEEDWYKTFIALFTTKWRKGIEMNEEKVLEAKQILENLREQAESPELLATIDTDLAKLDHALEYYDWLERLVKSFESGEIFKYIPKTKNE